MDVCGVKASNYAAEMDSTGFLISSCTELTDLVGLFSLLGLIYLFGRYAFVRS